MKQYKKLNNKVSDEATSLVTESLGAPVSKDSGALMGLAGHLFQVMIAHDPMLLEFATTGRCTDEEALRTLKGLRMFCHTESFKKLNEHVCAPDLVVKDEHEEGGFGV